MAYSGTILKKMESCTPLSQIWSYIHIYIYTYIYIYYDSTYTQAVYIYICIELLYIYVYVGIQNISEVGWSEHDLEIVSFCVVRACGLVA